MHAVDMPAALRRYLLLVATCGPLIAVLLAVRAFERVPPDVWGRGLLLAALAAVAYGRPMRVTHKYSYDVSEVLHVAMVLLFPPWLPGLLVVLASGLHFFRRSAWNLEQAFNLAQAVTYVTVGALCLAALEPQLRGVPSVAGLPHPLAIVVTLVAMLLVNTGLVAGAIALDTRGRFWRLWRSGVASIGWTYVALVALGVVVALIVRDYPLALAPLLLPVALAQYAMRREVQLRADTRAALSSLVEVVELRDPYTAGHSERVAALARALAVRLGLTGDEADLIETAGQVHDLGKVAIDPAILAKQGPLTEAEWAEMKRHPGYGADVVGRFAAYRGCAPLVRHHHERVDGGGYPDGLAGEAIPFGARILAVADAYDALTGARSYRPAHGPTAALRIIEQGAGSQWDARVVEALVEHQREIAPAPAPVRQPRAAVA